MGTTAEKLQNIISAKADIGQAITEKGGMVPERFLDYGKAIRELPGGGGLNLEDQPLDPWRVYRAMRASTWLPMPEPGPMEVWLLVHIPVEGTTVTCTFDAPFTVDVGGPGEDGTFVSQYTEEANGVFERDLAYDEFGNVIGTSTHQALVRFRLKAAEDGTYPQFLCGAENAKEGSNLGVVELWGNLADESGTAQAALLLNAGATYEGAKMYHLKFVRMKKTKRPTGTGRFGGLAELVAVLEWGEENGTVQAACFSGCGSLLAVPQDMEFFAGASNAMFSGCTALPAFDFSKCKVKGQSISFLRDCRSIRAVKNLDISGIAVSAALNSLFSGSTGLVSVEGFNPYPANKNINITLANVFNGCVSLRRLTFAPYDGTLKLTSGGLNLTNTNLDREGIVEMFRSLPEANNARIRLDGTPGAAELTEEDIAIATEKGWRIETGLEAAE